ncbi:unnamed protein product [Sphenostylis stenocarpa]|uniref:Uncharacterized protein n=1 Tax=Sphenostylis stenocarpa TaxID=92480 RepID=A0AA86TJ89_9FABA|nr:unnamed protein product [Sphenostylis stenocarpa]
MENEKREVRDDHHHHDDDDNDETKMEKFYALLRSFRHARDRRRRELVELENNESSRKKMKAAATSTKAKQEVAFEFQDFTTDIHFRKPPLVFPNPISCDTTNDINKGKKNKEKQDLALDLKLAL